MTTGRCLQALAGLATSPRLGDSVVTGALRSDSLRGRGCGRVAKHSGWMNPRAGSAPGGVASGSPGRH